MARIVYRKTPYNTKDGVGVVVLTDDMPDWQRQDWLRALEGYTPEPAAFVPAFLPATVSVDNGMGQVIVQNIDPGPVESFHSFFATSDTALALAKRYGTGEVVEIPSGYGVATINPSSSFGVKLKSGRVVNAGVIASYFVRNSEEETPGTADLLVRSLLGL